MNGSFSHPGVALCLDMLSVSTSVLWPSVWRT
jgi:hypothetical protein